MDPLVKLLIYLGPQNTLFIAGLIIAALMLWFGYRIVRRPLVDVYTAVRTE